MNLVDPDRDLEAEGRGHGVLAVGARRHHHVGRALGEVGHRSQRLQDELNEDPVRLPQHQEVAGLHDVLRRRAPMHPAAGWLAADARQFPHQRHDGVTGALVRFVDAGAIHQAQLRAGSDPLGAILRHDAEIGLRPRQRRLDVEPCLPAVLEGVECANSGIRQPCAFWRFLVHPGVPRLCCSGPRLRRDTPQFPAIFGQICPLSVPGGWLLWLRTRPSSSGDDRPWC